MAKLGLVFVLSCAVLVASGDAFAADLRRNVTTTTVGREVRLTVHSVYGSDCTGGPRPKVTVLIAPRNGTLSIRNSVEVVNKPGNPCHGKSIPGTGVFYKPKAGFRGEDRMLYDRLTADGDLVFSVYARAQVR